MEKEAFITEVFPSFQGEGVMTGTAQLFVRFAGCNLKCSFCDTDFSKKESFPVYGHVGELLEEVVNPVSSFNLAGISAGIINATGLDWITLTGGEPLLQSSFVAEYITELRAAGVTAKIYLETNATLPGEFLEIQQLADFVSADFKLPSVTGGRDCSQNHRDFYHLCRRIPGQVKIVVSAEVKLPDFNSACKITAEAWPEAGLIIQPVTGGPSIPIKSGEFLFELYRIAREYVPDVRVMPQVHHLMGIK